MKTSHQCWDRVEVTNRFLRCFFFLERNDVWVKSECERDSLVCCVTIEVPIIDEVTVRGVCCCE